MFGIDNLKGDVVIGILVGILILFLKKAAGLTMGFPSEILGAIDSSVFRFILFVVVAPILETMLFQDFFLNRFGGGVKGIAIQAALFAALHLVVYTYAFGSIQAAQGALIGAAIFGVIFGILTSRTNNILPAVIPHAMFNFALLKLAVVG